MKKLSLMLALVLALGVFATACSEDDEAAGVTKTFVFGGSPNAKSIIVTPDAFTHYAYLATDPTTIEYGWKGTYTIAAAATSNYKVVNLTSKSWINNANNAGSTDWVTNNPFTTQNAFYYTFPSEYEITNTTWLRSHTQFGTTWLVTLLTNSK